MHNIELVISGQEHRYSILIGTGLLEQLGLHIDLQQFSKVFVVTDRNMKQDWLPRLEAHLPEGHDFIVLPTGEQAKSLETVKTIWTAMVKAKCDRSSLVVILGGGVVGDMGAFAASTYMRGVPFVQIPSTLLAQVDSSIGGKTGFDFEGLKNFIGTFAQPIAVVIDTNLLETLPERELTAGFAEMFKHGLIKDVHYFQALGRKKPTAYSKDELADLISTSTRIKAAIVEQDENEIGDRKLLNFGHTVGHAVEALSWQSDYPLLHGEAVAIGMVVEADISREKGFLLDSDVVMITEALRAAGLPVHVPHLPAEYILEKMYRDKKNEHGHINCTLLGSIGAGLFNQVVEPVMIIRALGRHMEPEPHAR
jgi:3-dehydroquinate synthase